MSVKPSSPPADSRSMRAKALVYATMACAAAATSACSAIFGFDGFEGGPSNESLDGGGESAEGGTGETQRADGGAGAIDAAADSAKFVGISCSESGAATCVPPPPAGWMGPVIVFEGAVGATAPTCPGADITAFKGYAGLDAGAPACTPCSCTVASTSCADPLILGDFDGTCQVGPGTPLPKGQCVNVFIPGDHAKITRPAATATCSASGGAATLPAANWSASGGACNAVEMQSASCPSGQTCRAAPPAGFIAGKYCVFKSGAGECTTDPFTERRIYSDGTLADDRGCGACACDAVGGTCDSSGDVEVYPDMGCPPGGENFLSVPSNCAATNMLHTKSAKMTGNVSVQTPPTCGVRPGTGQPHGTAAPQRIWTACCTP